MGGGGKFEPGERGVKGSLVGEDGRGFEVGAKAFGQGSIILDHRDDRTALGWADDGGDGRDAIDDGGVADGSAVEALARPPFGEDEIGFEGQYRFGVQLVPAATVDLHAAEVKAVGGSIH